MNLADNYIASNNIVTCIVSSQKQFKLIVIELQAPGHYIR